MFTKEQLRDADGLFDSRGVSLESEREYFNSQLLNHPYIVRAFDTYEAFDSEGILRSHVVLEWVDGIPLSFVPHGSIAKQQSLHNLQMLLRTLIFAYQQGFVHLDLHGKNIMMDARQEIKLIDLGSFMSLDSQAHSLQTLSDRLNEVLDVCDEILGTGNWVGDEAYRVSWSLASLVQTPEAAQYCHTNLSQQTVGTLVECLYNMDRALANYAIV
jgi:serine/threonine protein kinase